MRLTYNSNYGKLKYSRGINPNQLKANPAFQQDFIYGLYGNPMANNYIYGFTRIGK